MPAPKDIQRARECVGESPIARASWLLNFSRREMATLSQTAWDQLRLEWVAFLGEDFSEKHIPPSKDQIETWRQQLNREIVRLAEGRTWRRTVKASLCVVNGTVKSNIALPRNRDEYRPAVFKAMQALAAVGDRLRVCANEGCTRQRLYVVTGRRRYCSPTCRGTVNTRAYRRRRSQR
jgi:hypothetical protein